MHGEHFFMLSHFQESANDRFAPIISLPWMAGHGLGSRRQQRIELNVRYAKLRRSIALPLAHVEDALGRTTDQERLAR
jgi:hypothetical protein